MTPPLDGKIDILTGPPPSGLVTITLNGMAGDILVGGSGQAGAVLVRDGDGKTIVRIASATPARPSSGGLSVTPTGGITIYDGDGHTIISVTTAGDASFGGNGVAGDVMLKRKDGQTSVSLRGDAPENISVRDRSGKPVFNFAGDAFDNKTAGLWLGTHTADGGKKAALVVLRGRTGNDAIVLNGGEGENIFVRDAGNKPVFNFAGDAFDGTVAGLWIGGAQGDGGKKPGLIALRDNEGRDSIVIDGAQGDIVFNNADCAEDFDVSDASGIEPGIVMVIGGDGRLRPSDREYDRKVAGVVAGAGECRPAIVLGRHGSTIGRHPIALSGRTFCRVDAASAAIDVGDLLTTSSTPGHAMKVTDPTRAFGAVIGKALQPLARDTGLIPILVSLQ